MNSPTTSTRSRSLSVRFEDTCVLIPPALLPPKSGIIRPRLITKSYSLPLWKTTPSKKSAPTQQNPASAPDHDPVSTLDTEKERAEKKAFSLTLSVPISVTTKTRPRRPSLPPQSPCLSKRANTPPTSPISSSPSMFSPPLLKRAPSFPQIQPSNLTQAETIPLRPCCEACHPCVDAALAEGESWAEKWSKGAVRRHSEGEHVHPTIFGVTRVWMPETGGVCEDPDGEVGLAEALQVDEIEAKRRSGDFSHAVLNNRPVPPSVDEDALADSDEDEPLYGAQTSVRPPIMLEEDADLLFPLPSPRRSPNLTPCASPISGSLVNLVSTSQSDLPATSQLRESDRPQETLSPIVVSASAPILAPIPRPSPSTARLPTHTPLEPAPTPSESPTRTRQHSTSPTLTRPSQPRRSSFTSALKSSASVLKGAAAGMLGAGISVGVVP